MADTSSIDNVLTNRCPNCGYDTDRTTAIGAEVSPAPGDLSICIACGEWSVFEVDLSLRAPTDEEFVVIGEDRTCRRVRAGWAKCFAASNAEAGGSVEQGAA